MAKEQIQVRNMAGGKYGITIEQYSDEVLMSDQETLMMPHRHDHYTCFLLEHGEVSFNVDFQELAVRRQPCIFVSFPGQVHELKHIRNATGWFIAFEAHLVDQHARIVIEQSFARVALLSLNDNELKWFKQICALIKSTTCAPIMAIQQQLAETLINAFFLKAVVLFESQEDERIRAYSSRSIEIARQFQILVREQFMSLKKPADYAIKMNMTVSYLNDTVKSVTGFTSTLLIRQEVFREAQRLLFYTPKTVQEIAFELGYDDYKYFIRLFGKTLGISPSAFRKRSHNPNSP